MAHPRLDGQVSEADWGLPRAKSDLDTKSLGPILRLKIKPYVMSLGYKLPTEMDTQAFWKQIHLRASQMDIPYSEGSQIYECLKAGGSYAILCFPKHPLEIQVYIGLLSWIAILTDDHTSKSPEDFSLLGKRLLQGEKQAPGLATIWADLLLESYSYYDTYIANCIVYSSLDAVNACVLETRDENRNMVPTRRGQSWPWYKRDKDGAGEAFACLTFPKAMYPDIALFMESIPDLAVYSALTNDILSYYKEEIEGETKSYVNSRAMYENKSPLAVLTDIIEEAQQAYRRVESILNGREPYKLAAQDYVRGSVAFHMVNKRYRLSEIGLGIDDHCVFGQLESEENSEIYQN